MWISKVHHDVYTLALQVCWWSPKNSRPLLMGPATGQTHQDPILCPRHSFLELLRQQKEWKFSQCYDLSYFNMAHSSTVNFKFTKDMQKCKNVLKGGSFTTDINIWEFIYQIDNILAFYKYFSFYSLNQIQKPLSWINQYH